MPARVVAAAVLAVAVLAARPALAGNGFVIGLEFANGAWSADPQKIVGGSGGQLTLADATAFTAPIDDKSRPGAHLHLGWNVGGHVAFEGVFHTSLWDPFADNRGGGAFIGGRTTWYPTNLFLPPKRQFDFGLDVAYGWTIAGGPTFGMDGTFMAFGAMAEYVPVAWFSLGIGYRYFRVPWNRFILDYEAKIFRDVNDFAAGWGTITIALNFHMNPQG